MRNVKITAFLFALLISVTSFGQKTIKGNGKVVKDDSRKVANFTKIHVATGIDAYITQGNENKISLEADENIIKLIKTEVKDGVLKVSLSKNVKNTKKLNAYITAKTINGLIASSGADVIVKNTVTTSQLSCKVSSGADMTLSASVDDFKASASSGSDLIINKLIAKSTSIKASSGSDVEIKTGKTDSFKANASSAADIDAEDFSAQTCSAMASSGADLELHVVQSLKAKASSGGDINYKGSPTVDKKTTTGGDVSNK